MNRIFSNGPRNGYVRSAFNNLAKESSHLFLAAPYFTSSKPILDAIKEAKSVSLLVGLNHSTSPNALREIHEKPGVKIRYLTHHFHAKIYLFDQAVLLGSANLTDGGLLSNREAVVRLDWEQDSDAVEEVQALFHELWDASEVLTSEILNRFNEVYKMVSTDIRSAEAEIEKKLGRVEPPNIRIGSEEKSKERMFLDRLQREIYEQYGPAFREVQAILEEHSFRRDDLAELSATNETNRFLNYVRLTHVVGDEVWRSAPLLTYQERRGKIMLLGREWYTATDNKVPPNFIAWLSRVNHIFESSDSLESATKEDITEGLMSLHAFTEQSRFVLGGERNLPEEFWKNNDDDFVRVRASLSHLLHGKGEFVVRLHDLLFDPSMKLGLFGYFCALELFGTVNPEECPPLNGRMAKSLRFLGFDVKPTS